MQTTTVLVVTLLGLALSACGSARDSAAEPTSLATSALQASGTLDSSYGALGLTVPEGAYAAGLSVQGDGKALVLTGTGRFVFPPELRATLTRLMPNGQPDVSFGQSGAIELAGGIGALALVCPHGANAYNDWGATCQDPERPEVAVTVTSRDIPAQRVLKVYRFLPSGQPDPSFGTGGVALAPSAWTSYVIGLSIQADGKTLMVGNFICCTTTGGYLARLQRDGAPDPDFGDGGLARLPPDALTFVTAIALPKSEHPLVLATDFAGVAQVFRFTDDGKPDRHFGTGGMVQLNFDPLGGGRTLLALDDGRLVVGGTGGLWRLRSNGAPDPSFGIGGHAVFPNLDINKLVLDDQNRLVAAVDAPRAKGEATIARFKSNGSLDPSFGVGGVAHVNLCPQGCSPANFGFDLVALQRDGRILAEATESFHKADGVMVARLLP